MARWKDIGNKVKSLVWVRVPPSFFFLENYVCSAEEGPKKRAIVLDFVFEDSDFVPNLNIFN